MRKGFLFSFDALLATMLLIGGVILIASIAQRDTDDTQVTAISRDIANALANVRVREITDATIVAAVVNGSAEGNVTVLEQIGYYWATGKTAEANALAAALLTGVPQGYRVRVTFDGVTVHEQGSSRDNRTTAVAARMLSGIAQGQAITGSSASAYLKRIKDKRTSAFLAFGGFIGQGDLTWRLPDLPSDANITALTLELAAGSPFTIALNGASCGGTYTPDGVNGSPSVWDLSACSGSVTPGSTNILAIAFPSQPFNASYVAGGFLRVRYKTQEITQNSTSGTLQYRFPGVEGVINIYDAFYVPGTLRNLSVYLHYNASNSTYLRIGEKRVWSDVADGVERQVVLNDSYLKDPAGGMLDYDFLSNKTVPLRLSGFAPNQTILTSGDADVILITDFTGSMKKAVSDWDQGNLGSNCASAYTDSDVRRTLLAQCVDTLFVDAIMNYSGNRIWPVFIYDNSIKWYNNPTDESAISGYINSYANGKDKTCYACAFNKAYDILQNLSNSSRKKFIVFMTDGVPTHCASGSCSSTSATYGTLQCQGLCDTAGACDAGDIPAQCASCTTNNGGQTNAYLAANRTVQDFDVTIFTVGFGPVTDCALAPQTLQQLALIGNGTYQHSSDSAQLKLIYENITQEILTRTTLTSQLITLDGPESASQLFDDSYINITYDLAQQYSAQQNMLSLTLQTPQACSPVLPLYPEQLLIEAQAVSYSGIHWSDYLSVNGIEAYNLSAFLVPYDQLGDPTLINAPLSSFAQGNNTFTINTGDTALNSTGCFANDSIIYTVLINLSTERSVVVPNATGCVWLVQFEDGALENITIPSSYTGSTQCSYRPGNITYQSNDAYQLGTYAILNRLDFRKDGTLFVNLRDEDLEIIVTTIGGIPYLWGPAIARVEVTR